ncbi:hypothetical protein Tco_0523127 [Tanacetum coccineum]
MMRQIRQTRKIQAGTIRTIVERGIQHTYPNEDRRRVDSNGRMQTDRFKHTRFRANSQADADSPEQNQTHNQMCNHAES